MSEHCLIKKNTPELRKKLEDAGLSVCICTTFEDADWNNNYLIYLYADLDKWKVRLDLVNKDYSSFYEPDLGNQLTAIALQDDGRMFKKLKLVRE